MCGGAALAVKLLQSSGSAVCCSPVNASGCCQKLLVAVIRRGDIVAGGSATAVAEAEIAVRGKVLVGKARTHWGLLVKSPLKPDALAESCTESCRLQMPEV